MRVPRVVQGQGCRARIVQMLGKACKMKQNLTMLQGQGCRARIVKLLEKACKMKQKGDRRINRFIRRSPFAAAGAPWRAPERGPARLGARGAPLVKTLKRHGNSCISQLGARGDSRERACGPGRGLERRGAVGKQGKSEKTRILPQFSWFRSYVFFVSAYWITLPPKQYDREQAKQCVLI